MKKQTTKSTRGSKTNKNRTKNLSKKIDDKKKSRNNVKSNTSRPAKTASKGPSRQDLPRLIAKELADTWDIHGVRNRNDDYIISCITGKYNNDISLWPALRIQRARTITSIDSKIKSSAPLRSDAETVLEFIKTQDEPIIGRRYSMLLKDTIESYFADFKYDEVLAKVEDPSRTRIITNGSAYPQLLAPVQYEGKSSNAELLAAMTVGEGVFLDTFDARTIFEGVASGKITNVPKNYKTSRTITITNREVIDKQQVISIALRDYCTLKSRTSNHIIQFDDQSVQHKLLNEGYATIDLSSASDRIYKKLLMKVWPQFMDHFERYLPKTVVTDEGRIVPLTCVGTQGYPLTFTLMAIVCGLIVQTVKFNPYPSSNYGDDIIVHESDFEEVIVALEALGLQINKGKTHRSSNGFLESCGMDAMFTRHGRREITPIYLRGTSDIEVVQFFHQLCDSNLISSNDATSIMSRLGIEFYAFEYDYQLTEFHFPYGDILNVPRAQWSPQRTTYVCSVPSMKDEVDSIKGLSSKESAIVLDLLHIEARMKSPEIHKKTMRGTDLVARPYGLYDLQDHKLYSLYIDLSTADSQLLINFQRLQRIYNVSFKALAYYHFITSEMYKYKYSMPTVDFSSSTQVEITLSDFIESEFGVNSEVRYPIYRYKRVKNHKSITHPKSNLILGVDDVKTS